MPGSDLLLDTQHTFSARQEALWADAKIDGRVVFSIRETYKLHRERLIAIQRDVEMLRWLVKGCKGSLVRRHQERKNDASAHEDSCRNDCNMGENLTPNSNAPLVATYKSTAECKGECADQDADESPLYHFFNGLIPDVFCRVAEHYGQNYGEIIKFKFRAVARGVGVRRRVFGGAAGARQRPKELLAGPGKDGPADPLHDRPGRKCMY